MAYNGEDRRPAVRESPLTVRLSQDERRAIAKRAHQLGLGVSSYVRAVVLDAAAAGTVPASVAPAVESISVPREVVDLRVEVNRVGVNLNQLTRLANKSGVMIAGENDDVDTVLATLMEAREVLRSVQGALGGITRADQASHRTGGTTEQVTP